MSRDKIREVRARSWNVVLLVLVFLLMGCQSARRMGESSEPLKSQPMERIRLAADAKDLSLRTQKNRSDRGG